MSRVPQLEPYDRADASAQNCPAAFDRADTSHACRRPEPARSERCRVWGARARRYAQQASGRGLQVIIAGAGGAAHLPGMVAALTPLPVVGVPVKTSTLSGNDSLLSIVQMPRGVPVATVAIGNAANAGLLAVRMLGMADLELREAMAKFMADQEAEVLAKAAKLEADGHAKYVAP